MHVSYGDFNIWISFLFKKKTSGFYYILFLKYYLVNYVSKIHLH